MLALEEYKQLSQAPQSPVVMYQRWRSLLFLHFSCDPEEVQRLLPPGLEVDTFDGKAWVGLVPFRMEGIRPRFLPALPGISGFPETNVRSYVHRAGREPGVWFFSLDAANPLACHVGRTLWQLPYFTSVMCFTADKDSRRYTGVRQQGEILSLVHAEVGAPISDPRPGSLEYFLIERYLLYANRAGQLYRGRVHHPPYPLRKATVTQFDDGQIAASGLTPRPIEHVLYSPGVDVEIYGLEAA